MTKTNTNLPSKAEDKCAWEAGELGNSVEHAQRVSAEHEATVDEALGLQMISIRLPRSLIDDLKYFGKQEGVGYQPLMRRVLQRYVAHEYKIRAMEQLVDVKPKPAAPVIEDDQDLPIAACR